MPLSFSFSAWICFFLIGLNSCTEKKQNQEVERVKPPQFEADFARAHELLIKTADNFNKRESVDSGKIGLSIIENLVRQTDDSIVWITYAQLLFEIGFGYQGINQMDSSYPYLQKSYEVCMDHFGEDFLLTTMCLNKLSFYYNYIGDFVKERDNLFRSFRIRRKILDSVDIYLAYGYGNMAYYYNSIGDINKFKLFLDRANEIVSNQYKIYQGIHDPLKGDSLNHLLNYISPFPKWKNIFLSNVPRAYAFTLLNRAKEQMVRQNDFAFNSTIGEYKKVVQSDSIARKYSILQYLVLQSDFYQRKKDYITSDKYMDSLLYLEPQIKGRFNENNSMVNKIYFLIKRGNIDEASRLLNIWAPVKAQVHWAVLRRFQLLCDEKFIEVNPREVIKICDSAYVHLLKERSIQYKINLISWEDINASEAYRLLYFQKMEFLANFKLANETKELDIMKKAFASFEKYFKGFVFLQERNFMDDSKIDSESKEYPIYELAIKNGHDLFQMTGDIQYFNSLIQWSEANKAISLKKSILNTQNLNDKLELSSIADVIELQNLIERLKLRMIEHRKDTSVQKELILKNLENSLTEYTSQLEELNEKHARVLNAIYNPNDRIQYPLHEIKSMLGKQNGALIDYFVGEKYIQASLLSNDTTISHNINLSAENLQVLNSFILACLKINDSSYKTISEKAYDILIRPLDKYIINKSLIIIPDGLLYRVPFELLSDGAHPLIESHSIQYEYSSKLLLKKGISESKNSYAGFAPEYKGNEIIKVKSDEELTLHDLYADSRAMLGPLKFNIPEVIESAQIMKGDYFVGSRVDKETFLNFSKDARIVHLAMHAITDDQNPDYSQLFFKSDSIQQPLFAYELNEQEMMSELAILSACNTGVGTYRRGDGVLSLARAFKSAGCKNIVMSLWPANDASTKDIIVSLLKKIKLGEGKADALRHAKLEYISQAPAELKHPYYWAGLVLIGDNEVMHFSTYSFAKISIVSFITIGLLFSLVYFYKKKAAK